jgi:hypothetical protein
MSGYIGNSTPFVNGDAVSGRGLLRRDYAQRLAMAVAYKTGQLKLDPSLKSVCDTFGVSPADLRGELKTHDSPTNGNGSAGRVKRFVAQWASLSQTEREQAIAAIATSGTSWPASSARDFRAPSARMRAALSFQKWRCSNETNSCRHRHRH